MYVDGMLGAGGYARVMIEAYEEMEYFVGFDVDVLVYVLVRLRLEWVRVVM